MNDKDLILFAIIFGAFTASGILINIISSSINYIISQRRLKKLAQKLQAEKEAKIAQALTPEQIQQLANAQPK